MNSKRSLHLALCTTVSLLITVGAYTLDSQRTAAHQAIAGLRWARQVASQVEGLTYKAREAGERDPVGWAISYMAQGVEPRLVQVNKIKSTGSVNQGVETYNLDSQEGTFDFAKPITSEDGAGVHITVMLGYEGFLGARSILAGDYLVLVFFGLSFLILFLRTGQYFGFRDTEWLHSLITEWVNGAKLQLIRHSGHIREMVRQAQRLAVSANRSRHLVNELRGKIHSGLNGLHEHRQIFQEADNAAARAESLALNAAIEANRIGGDASKIAAMATELHRMVQKMRDANQRSQNLVHTLEKQLEPWTTDADLAFHAYDEVRDATDSLSQHIRKTTETLLGQAKLIQALNVQLGTRKPIVAAADELAPRTLPFLPAPLPVLPLDDDSPRTLFQLFRKIQKRRGKKAA